MILRAGITTFICLQVRQSPRACASARHTCPALADLCRTTLRCLLDDYQVPVALGSDGLPGWGLWPHVPAYAFVWQFTDPARSAADACLPATTSLPGSGSHGLPARCQSPVQAPACQSALLLCRSGHSFAGSLPVCRAQTAVDCLQEELPSHDEMKIGGHNGFMPYKAVAQMMAASLSGPVTQEVRSSILPALRVHTHCPRSSQPDAMCAM